MLLSIQFGSIFNQGIVSNYILILWSITAGFIQTLGNLIVDFFNIDRKQAFNMKIIDLRFLPLTLNLHQLLCLRYLQRCI